MQAGAATFVVRSDDPSVVELAGQLFVDLTDGDATTPSAELSVARADDDSYVIMVENARRAAALAVDGALAALVTAVTRLALDNEPDALHLHCAALMCDDELALISAASGTGKTTLTASLLERGWSYLSDESVALRPNSDLVDTFPKPLVLKSGGQDLVEVTNHRRLTTGSTPEMWSLVPASAVSATIRTSGRPSTIIILQRAADGTIGDRSELAALHPADAVVGLLGQTMDAERFGTDALHVLGALAARCRCATLTVGPLDAMCARLEELVRTEPPSREATPLVSTDAVDTAHGRIEIASSCRSILIDERVVLHDTHLGAIAALDEAGSALWMALHGAAPSWWHPETLDSAEIAPFLDDLSGHGFVEVSRPSRSRP